MATNNITLTHTLVNSGTAVILHNASLTFGFSRQNEHKPVPGKYDIVSSSYNGFENPKIKINGSFDVEDIETNEITQEILTNFITLQSTTPITLSVPTGSDTSPTYLKGRPTDGYETDGDQTLLNTISVVIDAFDIKIDSGSDLGRFWTYSITLTETQ